jgi:hypothetical protein
VSDPLAWIAAVGGVAARAGAWLGPVRARWQLRTERLGTDRARWENELHRRRFADVWNWQNHRPEGDQRIDARAGTANGPAPPGRRHGGHGGGPQTPSLHSATADDAYERYIEFLSALYEPGRLGPPTQPLQQELQG